MDIGGDLIQWSELTVEKAIECGATAAPFGDMKKMQTRHDPKVRTALQLPGVSICGEKSLKEILTGSLGESDNIWQEFEDVSFHPHALNAYQVDGHFDWHRDTPGTPI